MTTDPSALIRERWQQVCRLEYLTRRQTALTEKVSVTETELADLERDLAAESRDVERLQGASWAGLMASLAGDKNERLARERLEAEAVRQRVLGHRARLAGLREELNRVNDELRSLENARTEYEDAIRRADHPELADVGFRLATVEADLWEYEEARLAAQAAEKALLAVLQCLRDLGNASSRNIWRLKFAQAIREARVGQADQAAWYAALALDDAADQLHDIGVETRFELPPADLRWFLELYFDEELTDAERHDRIHRTYVQVEAIVRWAGGMNEHLTSRRQVLLANRTRLAGHWEAVLSS